MTIQVRSGQDWTFEGLYEIYDEIETIAKKDFSYDFYNNQIEVITSEQMMDAYASIGMPIFYNHWSFGKSFVATRDAYEAGYRGLAYEIVINSDPCISYIMEENDMMMQTLVIAHAAIGHNHFFKNNGLFQDWTQADYIIDYLEYAKKFVADCEERYGTLEVEKILDAAHALMSNGVHRYKQKEPLSFKKELQRNRDRALQQEQDYNDIWRTVPKNKAGSTTSAQAERQKRLQLPEGNILYFLEKYSPILKPWQREILRIVRNVAQYFYPQSQTKIMNEGCATWTHHNIMNKLYDKGIVHEGAMIEFIKSHVGVTYQPQFYHPYYSGMNPYAIGLAMMDDIVRISNDPTEEDKEWFPFAGCKDSFNVLKDAWANYRDESFIRQFLSPKVMRDFRMFSLYNDSSEDHYIVKHIHNEAGYRKIREIFANENTLSNTIPNVEVFDVDLTGDRELNLRLEIQNDARLHMGDGTLVVKHIANLWGYATRLKMYNKEGNLIDSIYRSPDSENNASTVDSGDYYYCC